MGEYTVNRVRKIEESAGKTSHTQTLAPVGLSNGGHTNPGAQHPPVGVMQV